jgi:hypothetical protein
LTYTGLTRAESTLTLFVEHDLKALLALRKRAAARTPQRNSRLFSTRLGAQSYRADALVHVTTRGELVRSKSEVIIANLLHKYEEKKLLSYEYEKQVSAPDDEWDLRLPDFTVTVEGKTFLWEHCGKTGDPIYLDKWERVRRPWYERHGYGDRLIVTYDTADGAIDSAAIEHEVIQGQILGMTA